MAENSKIEWTDHTFNPWRGCTKVSPACDHCYAETNSLRNPKTFGVWGKYGSRVVASDSYWNEPLKWDKKAAAAGERHRVFCASLADVFEDESSMPADAAADVKAARRRLFKLIQKTPNLDWLLLTKRPENIYRLTYEAIDPFDDPDGDYNACGDPNGLECAPFNELYPNVWLGTTVENQKYADLRIPALLKVPATVHFLSIEPMDGPVDLDREMGAYTEGNNSPLRSNWLHKLGWVICGGESGVKARPLHPDWPRHLRDQCAAAGIPFFFKQWGEWLAPLQISTKEIRDSKIVWPDGTTGGGSAYEHGGFGVHVIKVGKKNSGRLLDGREWNEMPTALSAQVQ